MKNYTGIILGEPHSINSEIIIKAWKIKKRISNIFLIGNYSNFKKQIIKLDLKIPLIKVNKFEDIKNEKKLYIINVPFKFKSIFNANLSEIKTYIFNSFNVAHKLAIKKKILGFINAPIDKKIFGNKYLGVTEYLSEKNKRKNKEVMLIYNKKLAVMPLTTHIEIKNVTNKITLSLIEKKIIILN